MSKVVLTDKIISFFTHVKKMTLRKHAVTILIIGITSLMHLPLYAKPLIADPAWRTQKLENGFSWQLLQATHRPSDPIQIRLVINTGSLSESFTEKGFLFSLFKGALLQENGLPLLQLNQFANTATENPTPIITMSYDSTIINLQVANNQPEALKTAINLLGTLVKHNNLSTEVINKPFDEKMADLISTKPQNKSDEFWLTRIKDSSLLGYDPVITSPSLIELDKLDEFYQKWFTPDAMNLYVVGKVDARVLTELVNKSFGDLQGTRQKPAMAAMLLPLESGALNLTQNGLEQMVLSVYWDENWNALSSSSALEKYWRTELAREAIFTRINNKLTTKNSERQKISFECNVLYQRQLCGLNLSVNPASMTTQFNKLIVEMKGLKESGIREDEYKSLIDAKNVELANLFAAYAHTDLAKLIDNRIHSQQNGIVDISLEQYQQLRQNFLATVSFNQINEDIEAFLARPTTLVSRSAADGKSIDTDALYEKYIGQIHPNKMNDIEVESIKME